MEEKARSQIQMEDYTHGSQNINEQWMQENVEAAFYNQCIKNLKTTHHEKDQAKHLTSQVVDTKDEPLQSCLKIMNDSTKCKNYTNNSSNLLQVNERAHSSEKSEVLPSTPNYTQQFIPVDSSDLKDQQNYDFSQTCSSSMKGNECNASRHETDTMNPLQKCSTVTIIPVFSAPNCQQTNSKMKLDIQSEMDKNNIRRAESGGTIALHDPFTPGQVNKHSEDNRRIAFLLKELNAVKESNKKLQDQLSENEEEMEVLKLNLELQDKAVEARVAEKAAVLVEEIYRAQSERDAAVMSRLRLANEERDEALLKSKQLEQAFEGLENINPEENDMCKWLEEELHLLKEQNQSLANNTRQLSSENNQECALKAQLISMQKERDIAFQQCKKQDEEIQTLRLYYSLHKSLSQEATLTDQLNLTLGTYGNALRVSKDMISTTHHRNEDLASQLQLAMTEHADMEMKLQQALGEKNELIENVQKLERLVDVLRKKVGTGNVRTVT
ncbi:mirror-image polydactyly gene 1 protein isoform X3 [Mobula birostris]|uniref:mirror-image polydactyly gene 1 protein isoform X3 n=1 Tax=Mobula birostris TaxID=1983395 RepID=UPI003B286A40